MLEIHQYFISSEYSDIDLFKYSRSGIIGCNNCADIINSKRILSDKPKLEDKTINVFQSDRLH